MSQEGPARETGCRHRTRNKLSVFLCLLAAEEEQGRGRKDPLCPAVFENPTGIRSGLAWGCAAAFIVRQTPPPKPEKRLGILRRRVRAETVGL
jgi:hypothetical protein